MNLNDTIEKIYSYEKLSNNALMVMFRRLIKEKITGKELAVLITLIINKDRITTIKEIGVVVWSQDSEEDSKAYNTVVVTLNYLKEKLSGTEFEITSKRNVGYQLVKKGQ